MWVTAPSQAYFMSSRFGVPRRLEKHSHPHKPVQDHKCPSTQLADADVVAAPELALDINWRKILSYHSLHNQRKKREQSNKE
ncbi:hypothetical protein E2C01_024743 [Portunus trituberculatus]|uniref:Uncharacterized protein n=1 Tax=Portunus trituberculatus TaxID=210409 RepID=A0A5B7EFZ2_PORTR|nr:hypothetical protein [Portunus trituberculatus]